MKAYDLERSLQEVKASGLQVQATVTPLNGLGIEEKVVLVQIADNVKVKVDRGSVGNVLKEAKPEEKTK